MIDGDTLEISWEHVRFLGVNTPERGELERDVVELILDLEQISSDHRGAREIALHTTNEDWMRTLAMLSARVVSQHDGEKTYRGELGDLARSGVEDAEAEGLTAERMPPAPLHSTPYFGDGPEQN